MDQGFILDRSYHDIHAAVWVDGHPEKSFWSHTKAPGHAQIPIAAFRCSNCGFLEFYALPEYKPR